MLVTRCVYMKVFTCLYMNIFNYVRVALEEPYSKCVSKSNNDSLMFIPCISDVLEQKTNNMH
jgi:hypothetical protein